MDGLDEPSRKYIMVEVFNNIISSDEINALLDWFYNGVGDFDDRMDVISKRPLQGHEWPESIVKKVLDSALDKSYDIEQVIFYDSRISFRLHADSGDFSEQKIYKTILIPLLVDGPATTVIFDNYYYGIESRFSRKKINPFCYNLPNRNGQFITVDDIRVLLDQCKNDPLSVVDFEVSTEFIEKLTYIVRARSGERPVSGCITDYTKIINYQDNILFDEKIHQKFLSHVPIENLHGLTIDKIVPWHVGQVITFDRSQLHSAGSGHTRKIGITVFTNLK